MTRVNHDHPLLSLREAIPLAEAEVERARRYSRDLSVIVIDGGDVTRFPGRIPDLFVQLDRSRVLIVAPETDAEQADVFAARVCAAAGSRPIGSASFPGDGTTFAALLRAATPERHASLINGVPR